MNRTQHPSNNDVLGAPKGWDQRELPCSALPITRLEFVEGVEAVASFWRPTAEEIKALAAGACVVLYVLGTTMPPVSLAVDGV